MSGKAPLAGPAANTLEASSSRLALSLSIPQPGVCYPGQTLYAAVRFKGDTKYEKLSLKLKAETPLRVWGKDRWVRLALLSYPALRHLLIIEVRLPDPSTLFAPVGFTLQQAGAVASATLGGGGGVPVTNLERWTFVDLDIPLTSSGRHDIGDDKRKHPGSSHSHPSPEEGVYEFVVPLPPDGQVLPSLPAIAGAIDGGELGRDRTAFTLVKLIRCARQPNAASCGHSSSRELVTAGTVATTSTLVRAFLLQSFELLTDTNTTGSRSSCQSSCRFTHRRIRRKFRPSRA